MLVLNTNPTITMTSREIAELTGKEHGHVMRDIRAMFETLEIGQSTFGASYLNSQNKEQPMFRLPYDETICLLTGYDAKARMAVIKRWRELETTAPVVTNVLPPMTLAQKQDQLNAARQIMSDESLKRMFPLVWQQVTDGIQNDIVAMFGSTPLLGRTIQAPLDIMEIAKRNGITVPNNRKGVLGKTVKRLSSVPPVTTERVINGAVRVSYAYTNIEEVAGIIAAALAK
jgi:Rha family phage regulatory protein